MWAWVTLQVTFFGSLLAIVSAVLAALGRLSPWRALRWFSITYIEVFRGTSLLVQLFWLFFVLPLPPFNIELSPYAVALVGLRSDENTSELTSIMRISYAVF